MALGLIACGSGSPAEVEAPSRADARFEQELRAELSPVVDGLSEAHRSALPILERQIRIPAVEHGNPPTCHRDRVYADGARYLLTTERWLAVRPVSSQSMTALTALYGDACEGVDSVFGNDDGSEIHLVNLETCHARLLVTGIAAGGLARLGEVPTLLEH